MTCLAAPPIPCRKHALFVAFATPRVKQTTLRRDRTAAYTGGLSRTMAGKHARLRVLCLGNEMLGTTLCVSRRRASSQSRRAIEVVTSRLQASIAG